MALIGLIYGTTNLVLKLECLYHFRKDCIQMTTFALKLWFWNHYISYDVINIGYLDNGE